MKRSVVRKLVATAATAVLIATAFVTMSKPSPAQAISGSDFNPGNIISDAVMFAGNSMTEQEVQAFLNARVPRCTLGDAGKPAGGWYAPHSVYLANNCLKNYSETVPSIGADRFCGAFQGGTYSAAQIIARVGQACNVSPRVLIVLLEKEQSLITDSWPNTRQYASATGLDCPDTAPCGAASAGFFRQVFGAAQRFQNYGTAPYTWRPAVGQVQQILYNLEGSGCGSSAVRVQNRATAALYYYTPYQPNAAALANLYGTAPCGAYGNRNFWRIYSDWFGSTQEIAGSREYITSLYNDVLGRAPENETAMNYWVTKMATGFSRAQMASAFNNSDEYRNNKIRDAYSRALKRQPEPEGAAYWLDALRRGQLSPDDLYSTFLYSDEMFLVQGQGTNAGYVSALYREVLSREPEPDGLVYWTAMLDRGESRSAISNGIWFSTEKTNSRVRDAYRQYLGREASESDQAYWSNIARSAGPTQMRSLILASDEYWNRANVRY